MITLAKKLLTGSGAGGLGGNGYVEFVSSTPMTITPKYTNSGVTLQYSLDAKKWTTITSGATTPSANIIYFRGRATKTKSLYTAKANSNAWVFTGSTNLECNGKLDRLLQNTLGGDSDILTIDNYCFNSMFRSANTLIKAPELPATTLGNNCYDCMFFDCTGLITAPTLPATTLAFTCYNQMFQGCTGLITAPELPATTLAGYCYQYMFYGCTSLTAAPKLPATSLANYCYYGMFRDCTSIPAAPTLPATTIPSSCYGEMFTGCTSLKLSETKTDIYNTEYRIPTVGTGTAVTYALSGMFTGTGGTFKGTPTINTTYYTENTPV